MTENTNYRQLIDDFLSGRISERDKASLEERLNKDPGLKNEFELQKGIINSIRDSRKMELKQRLDHINVHWYHSIPSALKIAAAVSLIAVTSLSAYFYIDSRNETPDRIDLSEQGNVEWNIAEEEMIPEKPTGGEAEEKPSQQEDISLGEEKKTIADDRASTSDTPETETEETAYGKDQAESQSLTEAMDIDVYVPEDMEEFEGIDDVDMDEATNDNLNNISGVSEDMSSKLEVKTLQHKKYNFHYALSEGILTLYGNFEDIPYEILEINSSEGKRVYLNYKSNFYRLSSTSSITELKPVTDETLINELKIVNENK